MHASLEFAAVLLVFVPLFAVARAYHQTPSVRLALAFLAFTVLEFRTLFLLFSHTLLPVDHYVEELIEFGADLGIMVLFAGAFLYRPRWSPGQPRPDLA